jgi:hypothetical protein
MKRRQIPTWRLLLLVAACVVITLAWRQYRELQDVKAWSDAKLVLAYVEHHDPTVTLDDRWKIFNDAEYNGTVPASGFGVVKDPWGRRFGIAGRRLENDTPAEFVVWSAGADGIAGDKDDLVVPENRSNELKSILESTHSDH